MFSAISYADSEAKVSGSDGLRQAFGYASVAREFGHLPGYARAGAVQHVAFITPQIIPAIEKTLTIETISLL